MSYYIHVTDAAERDIQEAYDYIDPVSYTHLVLGEVAAAALGAGAGHLFGDHGLAAVIAIEGRLSLIHI